MRELTLNELSAAVGGSVWSDTQDAYKRGFNAVEIGMGVIGVAAGAVIVAVPISKWIKGLAFVAIGAFAVYEVFIGVNAS